MKRLACVAAFLICFSVSAQSVPKGWQVIADRKCQYAVPAGWTRDPARSGVATSPDNKVTVVTQPVAGGDSLAEVEKRARAKMPPLKIVENSARREWYVYRDPADGEDSPDTHWYVAVRSGDRVCAVQLTFKTATGDSLPRQILRTIGPRRAEN